MSSTPMSPQSSTSAPSSRSSPSTSPPTSPAEDETSEKPGKQMQQAQAEDDKLHQQSLSNDADTKKTKTEEDEDEKKDTLADLDWFLSRSQGFSGTIMDQLRQALDARKTQTTAQPKLVKGGTMRDYQLEGLTWLTCLYQIGLNGILADEMGLGKTVQLISFLAFLREHGTNGPFLVLGPLSTISNWIKEFQRWTPDIPAVMYHGTPQVRAQLRRKEMKGDSKGADFPVVCTSYEICMKDKKFLANYQWKFIVVDEGHRLKNFNCKLVRELKQYPSESRLILTGTPLQNNLAELWSLLNFLLPEAFSDLEQFESMFDFSDVANKDAHKRFMSKERQQRTVASLHAILKPFLLRRVKNDVEQNLPKKREYILYAPLTASQKEIYRKIKDDDIRSYLEEKAVQRIGEKLEDSRLGDLKNGKNNSSGGRKRKAAGSGTSTPNKSTRTSRGSTPASTRSSARRSVAGKNKKNYEEVSDAQFFKKLENDSNDEDEEEVDEEEAEEEQEKDTRAQARREVATKKLQNPVMQLRLACNSPHHFSWPWGTDDPDETLVSESGKMIMLDRLVGYLLHKKKANHKIIIFSQFSKQLDILHEWASTLRGWNVCRIDGSISQEERAEAIDDFNTRTDHQIFLLSTRAGGLGINLVAADTVILYDSDWNPQQDLQAQDRAHRIGQTRPVIVYRMATKGTVEQTLLEKADGKRRLEKLVIQKDKFKSILDKSRSKKEEYSEIEHVLEDDEFENYDPGEEGEILLDEADLRLLTDRSEAAYAKAEKALGGPAAADVSTAKASPKKGKNKDRQEGAAASEKFRSVETKRGDADILSSMT